MKFINQYLMYMILINRAKLIKWHLVLKACSQFQMQKSLLSVQPKSTPINTCHSTILQTKYSTIQPKYSDIENVQIFSEDFMKISDCQPQAETLRRDSIHLEIQLDDGKVQMIFPKINDDPFNLARNFCEQHQLDEQMLAILTQNIKKTIKRLKKSSNIKKQKRSATQPTDFCPKQQNSKKIRTNTKQNVSASRDFAKKKESYRGSIQSSIQNRNFTDKQKDKKSNIQTSQYIYSPNINPLSQKISNAKQLYKSTKRQRLNPYDSVRTQVSIKTQPFDDKEFRRAQFNKENQLHTVFDHLYEDSRLKQLKKKEKINVFIKRNCKFKPQINATSRKIVANRSFEQRLNISIQKSSEKDIRNKKATSSSVKSSKDLIPKHYFKLQTFKQSQKPTVSYSLKNLTKNTHLSSSKQYLIPSSKNFLSQSSQPSKHTQKLYENQKQKAFKSIFYLLDDDEDGIISILNINLMNGIEQKLIQILFPVLQELQILQTELNQNQFCSAIDKLFGSLSIDQKGYLLKYCQNLSKQQKRRQENQPLKSTITPISQHLVTQTQRNNMNVYEYSKVREQLKQQKLQQQRIMKERLAMRDCTFHPKTNPKRPIYF